MSTQKKASDTHGLMAFPIAGRMVRVRERLQGMTDDERAWRAQWLKDQILEPDEPRYNPQYYKTRYSPLRRFYRWPLDQLENALRPKYGENVSYFWRHLISKSFFFVVFVYGVAYYIKYNNRDWMRTTGMRVTCSRAAVYPGDEGFPYFYDKTDREWATYGFEKSPI